jgi:hypothetical protein
VSKSVSSASYHVSVLSQRRKFEQSSPIVSLHEAPKNDVSVGIRSWNDVCFIILTVSHDVGIDLWRPCKQDLTSDWKAIRILNTRQVSSGVPYAVENHFRTLAQEGMIEMFKFATKELNTKVFKPVFQILNMPGRIDGHCSK